MSRWAALLLLTTVIACTAATQSPPHTLAVRVADPDEPDLSVRGSSLRDVTPMLRRTVARDFKVAAGDETSVLTLSITPSTFIYSLPLNDPRRTSDAPDIVWFNLHYTLETADGVLQKSGVIPVVGPEPKKFEAFDHQLDAVVKTAAIKLRAVLR